MASTPPPPHRSAGATGQPAYLQPYAEAAAAVGARFEALLWLSREGQARRFAVLLEMLDDEVQDRRVADLGCGRADLLEAAAGQRGRFASYVGVDGVLAMVDAGNERIRALGMPEASCRFDDFVATDELPGALVRHDRIDTFLFSGSLNTLGEGEAMAVLARFWNALAPGGLLVFNFLSAECPDRPDGDTGPAHRFRTLALLRFAFDRTPMVRMRCDYLGGHDATIRMEKP
jgi:SAM-dependent methyltransferase